MANLTQAQIDHITSLQVDLVAAKSALSSAQIKAAQAQAMAVNSGNARAANAAMRFKGQIGAMRDELDVIHAEASDALVQLFDNGGAIALGGGGGR